MYDKSYGIVFSKIESCINDVHNHQVLVAIDGQCASGKTTLGEALKERYDCNLFHMDDFFLRPQQRTPQRYAQPGGNVDRERFKEEVLDHIADPEGFSYRVFNCATWSLDKEVQVSYRKLNIIEGAYSQHPYFGDIYDLRFYCGIRPALQTERILKRNGPEKLKMFQETWIPFENRYLEEFQIRQKSIVI